MLDRNGSLLFDDLEATFSVKASILTSSRPILTFVSHLSLLLSVKRILSIPSVHCLLGVAAAVVKVSPFYLNWNIMCKVLGWVVGAYASFSSLSPTNRRYLCATLSS